MPTSREAVDKDQPWNQMLRAAVPDLALNALQQVGGWWGAALWGRSGVAGLGGVGL